MADLAGAVRSGGNFRKTELKVGYGSHRGYFVGLGDTFVEQSGFACKRCRGAGSINNAPCRACEGNGKRTTTRVPILYQLGPDLVQEELVTYTLSEPGKLEDGTPKSASTLWSRMKALSGLSSPSEQGAWFAGLEKPIKIPVEIMVVDNEAGTAHVIASVRRLHPRNENAPSAPVHGSQSAAPASAEAAAYDDADFDGLSEG